MLGSWCPRTVLGRDQGAQRVDQGGEVLADDVPDDVELDHAIAMYQAVAQADHGRPGDFRMVGPEFTGYLAGGLADDF